MDRKPVVFARFALAALLLAVSSARAALGELADVAQVSVGGDHACVVTNSGGAKCWKSNFNGQLGDGTTASPPAAGDVVGLSSGVVGISRRRAIVSGHDSGTRVAIVEVFKAQ